MTSFHRIRIAAAILTWAAVCAMTTTALAANPKDVARARNTRQIADCTHCDLTNAKMTGGFFQLANMIQADLSGANFDGANMAGVQLNGAKAINTSFVYTNFSGARLDGADMRGANFAHAWLNWTWFQGAKLDGANFAGARMPGTQLYGTDLSKVVGLTQGQLETSCGDASTILPPGLLVPACVVGF